MIKIYKKQKGSPFNDKSNYYIDITSPQKISFTYLLIKNFYVASISISAMADNEWKVILDNYVLMQNPDIEENSEKYFMIPKKNFTIDAMYENFTTMRIFLYQDSPYWKDYNLPEIKLIDDENEEEKVSCDKVKFESLSGTKQKYIFKDIGINIIIDKDELNQKYIDLSKGETNVYNILSSFS